MALIPRNPFDSGAGGGLLITGTTLHTGAFYAIQVLTATVLNTSNTVGNLGGDSAFNYSFPAGTVIYGMWSAIQLVSGSVIAYQT